MTKKTKAETGALGGRATLTAHGIPHLREAGRKGGETTLERHGVEHMRKMALARWGRIRDEIEDSDDAVSP